MIIIRIIRNFNLIIINFKIINFNSKNGTFNLIINNNGMYNLMINNNGMYKLKMIKIYNDNFVYL